MVTKRTKQVGAGATAIAAAALAAGYYFYASKDAKSNRRIAAKWAKDLKNEVIKEAKKAKDLNRAEMLAIVDRAVAAYETARSINPKELKSAARELKNNWQKIAGESATKAKKAAKKGTKKIVRAVKSAKKKAAKKR